MNWTIHTGDVRAVLRTLPAERVQCVVTSPPYWGLRSYLPTGHDEKHREIGSEPTPEAFVETMVDVFREVRRVLHPSGTVWLNLGDSYAQGGSGGCSLKSTLNGGKGVGDGEKLRRMEQKPRDVPLGLKPKDLCLIPWRVALALQADGWWLRSVICWHKKSCMPESVTDRPTNSWEPIFLLAKSSRYYYDAEAVKERVGEPTRRAATFRNGGDYTGGNAYENSRKKEKDSHGDGDESLGGRNQRNVWTLGPEPYSEAHFATFPTEIPRRAILAGTSEKGCCPQCREPWRRVVERVSTGKSYATGKSDAKRGQGLATAFSGYDDGSSAPHFRTLGWEPGCDCDAGEPVPCLVLDPFVGSGTTGEVAIREGRDFVGCELNPEYVPLARKRIGSAAPLFATEAPA